MTRLVLLASAFLLTASLFGSTMERQIIGSEQDHSLGIEGGDCEHFYKTTFTTFTSQVSDQEQREIPLTGVEPQLRVDATQEGGVSIRGWNRPFARLVVCRFAAANSRDQALRVLGTINVSYHNGRIEALGPAVDATQAWWVNMILYVPRGAYVDVRAKNGGVAIRNMNGRVKAHSTTGGVSVVQSTGKYVISTDSGGITLDRINGRVEAASRLGPIALKLPAASAAKPKIEARTTDAHIACTLKPCESKEARWAADRKHLVLGNSPADFRLTTTSSQILIGVATN